jgi:hypothetical protein
LKILALLRRRHPFPVQRIAEIDRWVESGEYDAILGGEYPRRENDPEDKGWGSWKDSADTYKEGFKSSAEPFSKWVKSTSEDVARNANAALDRIFGKDGSVSTGADSEAPETEQETSVDGPVEDGDASDEEGEGEIDA